MAITKESLNSFITKLSGERLAAVKEEIEAFYEEHFTPGFNGTISEIVGEIPRLGEKLNDIFDNGTRDAIIAIGGISSEHYFARDIESMYKLTRNLQGTIRQNARHRIIRTIEHPYENAFDYKHEKLNALVARLQKDERLLALLDRQKQIGTLRNELHDVVDAYRSGKQAYDTMVALGVDMSAYEEPGKNLPALVKLSADVCVLNGTC